ncbi:hypothetical protein HanXRQr2_Chr01g0012351 [Helianthus annuus]|uniref:Uncharacterized protein n=1 Tax=Helianthus annuus TaxID=4232 RepID=A0A9K3P3S1_HELAN|nr:hypothetical protein HanXRQr2_Chr01g0012351 [Helianthus annuus]KAJ0456951.1 hypothetical protein HanIR_Chr15g0768291 [Helianthus annuus]
MLCLLHKHTQTSKRCRNQDNNSIAITIHFPSDQYIQGMPKCRPHWVMLCRLSVIR